MQKMRRYIIAKYIGTYGILPVVPALRTEVKWYGYLGKYRSS